MTPPSPYPPLPPTYAVPLTERQCRAVQRAIALAMRSPEAEADHEPLAQAMGAIGLALGT